MDEWALRQSSLKKRVPKVDCHVGRKQLVQTTNVRQAAEQVRGSLILNKDIGQSV
jgi:hypothetical protein